MSSIEDERLSPDHVLEAVGRRMAVDPPCVPCDDLDGEVDLHLTGRADWTTAHRTASEKNRQAAGVDLTSEFWHRGRTGRVDRKGYAPEAS